LAPRRHLSNISSSIRFDCPVRSGQWKVNSSQEMSNVTSHAWQQIEIIQPALPSLVRGESFVNDLLVRSIQASDRNWVESFVKSRWRSEIIVAKGRVIRPAELDGFAAFKGKNRVGLLTYRIEGPDCEVVTIDSNAQGEGIGTALIDAVKERAKLRGCRRLWLITTNDNLHALGFYQKRGFRLIALYPNAIEASRRLKPQIAVRAANGIPIRDELELELELAT